MLVKSDREAVASDGATENVGTFGAAPKIAITGSVVLHYRFKSVKNDQYLLIGWTCPKHGNEWQVREQVESN